jgi:Asp/Glu/hydantoin racemase
VTYRIVKGAIPERLARAEAYMSLLQPFLDTARQLEEDGVSAILTSCGFLAQHQKAIAEVVSIPVFASALLQVPMAASTIGAGQRVGIITARAVLSEAHFNGVGWSSADIPVVQVAPPEEGEFVRTFVGNAVEADVAELDRDVAGVARQLVRDHPDVGAIVMECANLSPFSTTVRRITGLPVYDLYTLGMHAYYTCVGTEFLHSAEVPNQIR